MAPFSGQCNLRCLSTKVLQGSVATRVNYDRIFIDSFTANLLQSVIVKEFENRLAFRRVTGKNKVAPFFSGHGVLAYADDMVLLAPPWHGLQRLLKIVEEAAMAIDSVVGVGMVCSWGTSTNLGNYRKRLYSRHRQFGNYSDRAQCTSIKCRRLTYNI